MARDEGDMGVQEIEQAVQKLSKEQLAEFSAWFEEFVAADVDRKLEAAVERGFFDQIAREAEADIKAGRCTPL
jgi:hypothetical protein